jgi:hypothetical protein
MWKSLLIGITCLFLTVIAVAQPNMDNKQMEAIFKKEADLVEGEAGAWQLLYLERILLVLTDETNNRMRIFTPILEEKSIGETEMQKMLSANFHSALDAKYSLYNGFVISTFTHPLRELTPDQLRDAMKQVVNLADTFGTTYSSTDLLFGADDQEEEPEEKKLNISPRNGKKS